MQEFNLSTWKCVREIRFCEGDGITSAELIGAVLCSHCFPFGYLLQSYCIVYPPIVLLIREGSHLLTGTDMGAMQDHPFSSMELHKLHHVTPVNTFWNSPRLVLRVGGKDKSIVFGATAERIVALDRETWKVRYELTDGPWLPDMTQVNEEIDSRFGLWNYCL
jgi:hypothetical protein